MYSKLYKNAIKAENEVIKASISDKPFNWYYGEYIKGTNKYDCITDGRILIAFGFNTFAISKEIFEVNSKVLNNVSQLVDDEELLSYEPAQLIGTRLIDKKYTCCVLKKESTGEEILFNEKYKKYFTDNVEYKVYDSKSPIKIYNGDIFMGIILPVYVRE
jgi:hypothetical protein